MTKKPCPELNSHCFVYNTSPYTEIHCSYYNPKGKEIGKAQLGHYKFGRNHISYIEIKRNWRKRGCGIKILDDMIKKGGKKASASTIGGEALLTRKGFEPTSEVDDYGIIWELK